MTTGAEIAEKLGCKLIKSQDGGVLWDCPDDATVVRLLRESAEADAKLPAVRTLARELVRKVGRDPVEIARELHAYVLATIEWRRELVETFQSAAKTLQLRYGDCDDHARLIRAVLAALRIPGRIVIMHNPQGKPAHAVTQAKLRGEWTWLETSVPAVFGEAPLQAARRLGLHTRLNMPEGLSGLAALTVTKAGATFDGPIGIDVMTGAAVGAAMCSPLGTAVGALVGLGTRTGFGHGAAVGSGVGALVGAVGGGVFALKARAALAVPAAGGNP